MTRLNLTVLATVVLLGGYALYDAAADPGVYGPPSVYSITRSIDETGHDRISITASVEKLKNCDLESGDGPPWVDFYDRDAGVPPPSAFYRPDGQPAGSTRAGADERILIDGYTAIVPAKMSESAGTFVVRVPCQLWTHAPDGSKAWGRKVTATWGPAPVPFPGTRIDSPAPAAEWSFRP